MKRTLGWIITWLAAVGLRLSFAPAVHRSDHSRDARGKRAGGSSTEFSSCRILPVGGTIWIPSRGGRRKSSRVSDVFLMRIPYALLAPGPVWVNRGGPPGGYFAVLPRVVRLLVELAARTGSSETLLASNLRVG
jgi:hypothetical protein